MFQFSAHLDDRTCRTQSVRCRKKSAHLAADKRQKAVDPAVAGLQAGCRMSVVGPRVDPTEARMSAIVARGRLRFKRDGRLLAFAPSAFDIELLELIDAAISRRVPLGLILPMDSGRTGVVVAATMLIHHLASQVAQPEGRRRTSRVALVTRNPANRILYRNLYLKEEQLVNHYPLEIVLPGGRVDTKGELGRVIAGRFRTSVTLDRVMALVDDHDGLVVEASATNLHEVSRFLDTAPRIPFVYLTSNPFDPVLDVLDEMGATWTWTSQELGRLAGDKAQDSRSVCIEPELLARMARREYAVVGPEEQSFLDRIIPRLFDDLYSLRDSDTVDPDGLAWAWAVAHTLATCVVPLEYYERWASVGWKAVSLRDAPQKARAFAHNSSDDMTALAWEAFADDVEEAISSWSRNNKPGALLTWINDHADTEAMVVVRSRGLAQAVKEFLDDSPAVGMGWQERVCVTWQSAVYRGAVVWPSHVLIPGALTQSQAALLALPPVETLTVLSHGPWETGRIVRQIQDAVLAHHARTQAEHRTRAHAAIHGEGPAEAYSDQLPEIRIRHGSIAAAKVPKSLTNVIWNPFGVQIATDDALDSAEDRGGVSASTWEGSPFVEAIRIDFTDGVGYFEPSAYVSRIRGGEEKDVAAKSLRPGDVVVLVDKGARSSLFDLIAEALETLPEFQSTILMVREWRSKARSVLETDLTYDEILTRMQGLESGITTPGAISHWVHGRVIGPDDPEDIRRFGEAIGDRFLAENWRLLGKAIKTLRVHRRKVGRQLAKVIEQQSYAGLEEDGYFDHRLGIHMSDLAEALTTHTVVSVDGRTRPVPAHLANIVLQGTSLLEDQEQM